jgi:hypothetical protein
MNVGRANKGEDQFGRILLAEDGKRAGHNGGGRGRLSDCFDELPAGKRCEKFRSHK